MSSSGDYSSRSNSSHSNGYSDRYRPDNHSHHNSSNSSSNRYSSSYANRSNNSYSSGYSNGHSSDYSNGSSSRYGSSSSASHSYNSYAPQAKKEEIVAPNTTTVSTTSTTTTSTTIPTFTNDNEHSTTTTPEDNTDKIDFDRYDEIPVEVSGRDPPQPIAQWTDVDLGQTIQNNIKLCNYTKPTPIQKYSLPILTSGRDLMGCAQTGSGKTAAFLLPIIAQLLRGGYQSGPDRDGEGVRIHALVLSPTRELAVQTYQECIKFSRGTRIRSAVAYGGDPISQQLRNIRGGCDIIVATPGRLNDMLKRRAVCVKEVKFLVLDEADRMLDMGFEPQIREVIERYEMPATGTRQTMMFSATFAQEVQSLAASFLFDYVFLTVGRVGAAADLVTQKFIQIFDDSEKFQKLCEILKDLKGKTLVFCETKSTTAQTSYQLKRNGFNAASIHGDLDQRERTAALGAFTSGRISILIATDVAGRGLDIKGVETVINYQLPKYIDSYIHRIGRTGRAGKSGLAISFIGRADSGMISDLTATLADANQEIPEWFGEAKAAYLLAKRAKRGGPRFGGRDFRTQHGKSISNSYSRPQQRSWNGPPQQNGNGFNFNGPHPPPPPSSSSSTSYSNPYNTSSTSSYFNQPPQQYGYQPQANYPSYGYNNVPPPPPSSTSSSSSSVWKDVTSSGYDKKRRNDNDNIDSSNKYRKTEEGKSSSSYY